MSSKSHFIYEIGIEGYEETIEPQSIFGKFVGFNAYLLLDSTLLISIRMEGEYLFIETSNTDKLPTKFKIWGDAILYYEIDKLRIEICLKGGHHITKDIICGKYTTLE